VKRDVWWSNCALDMGVPEACFVCVLSPSISQHSLLPPSLPPSLQCVMGHDDVAAWLLARGASVDLVDSGGRSALFYASKIGSIQKEGEEGGEGREKRERRTDTLLEFHLFSHFRLLAFSTPGT